MDGKWLRSKYSAISYQALPMCPPHLGISLCFKGEAAREVLALSEPSLGRAGGKAQDEACGTGRPSHLVEGQIWSPAYSGYRLMPQLLLHILQIRQR